MARASLEELRLDYEDFLRQRGLPAWDLNNPLRQELIDRRCATADDVAQWVREVYERGLSGLGRPCGQEKISAYSGLAANAALVLLAVACSLLDRQIAVQAEAFENEGGFTERLYRVRTEARNWIKNK